MDIGKGLGRAKRVGLSGKENQCHPANTPAPVGTAPLLGLRISRKMFCPEEGEHKASVEGGVVWLKHSGDGLGLEAEQPQGGKGRLSLPGGGGRN